MRRRAGDRFAAGSAISTAIALVGGAFLGGCTKPGSAHGSNGSGAPSAGVHFERTFDASHFQKGNLHTHTNLSDGDSEPRDVITWYRSNGYNFLALTDHNILSLPDTYRDFEEPDFVLLSGEELTQTGAGKQVHINSICIKREIVGFAFPQQNEALVYGVRATQAQGGAAIVNHPNFDLALSLDDILASGTSLLEIASGHPYVNTFGVEGHPSHEALWDGALSRGKRIMGVGVDDVHNLLRCAEPPAYPGIAWVETFNDHADRDAICQSLREGDLYVSTGPSLRRISVTTHNYRVWPGIEGAKVRFVTKNGQVISEVGPMKEADVAELPASAANSYLRAVVEAPNGTKAWTPAVFVLDDP